MNGFEKHGLKHSSPSALNMWADCPGAWCARYLFGKQFSFGVAPQIGVLVEEVCARALMEEMTLDEAIEQAEKTFNKNNAFNTNQRDLARITDIRAMSVHALEALKPYGKPVFEHCIMNGRKQEKIELICNGDVWKMPVIGFLDFVYPDHGLVIDLKSTLRIPSEMSEAHKRQAAIYQQAVGNKAVKFLYVSPKKSSLLDAGDTAPILANVKAILNRQEAFLRLHDAETIRKIVPINTSSFYWNGSENILKELYGI